VIYRDTVALEDNSPGYCTNTLQSEEFLLASQLILSSHTTNMKHYLAISCLKEEITSGRELITIYATID
jgi:hypothetical protein